MHLADLNNWQPDLYKHVGSVLLKLVMQTIATESEFSLIAVGNSAAFYFRHGFISLNFIDQQLSADLLKNNKFTTKKVNMIMSASGRWHWARELEKGPIFIARRAE